MTRAEAPDVIALVDDADEARRFLAEWLAAHPDARGNWLLLACAPRMTHRISKWVSHSSREHWRDKWADKLFLQLLPLLRSKGFGVQTEVAKGPVNELLESLSAQSPATVLDWRKPKRMFSDGSAAEAGRAHWAWLSALAAMAALQECA